MSMDYLLRADEQKFVSVPVYFAEFYRCAKDAQSKDNIAAGDQSLVDMLKHNGVNRIAADHLLLSVDVTDLRELLPNVELNGGMERSVLTSQKILNAENSRRRNAQYKSIALRALRYDHIERSALARHSPYYLDCQVKQEIKQEDPYDIVKKEEFDEDVDLYKDYIIAVSVFLGYSRELEYHEIRLGRLLKVTDRIELTGAHTLHDLKNAFSCPADFAFTEDFSTKEPTVEDFAKNKYKSAMFFIHDTFYIEPNTTPNWEDPSLNIRQWAEFRSSIGPFNVKYMHEQKLGELTARLGQPYVFIHQGLCEHLLVFNDLFLSDEFHEGVKFPRRLVERNFRRIACDCCKEESAKWVVAEHEDLMPNSPGYLCTACYKELCFDTKGNKVCKFIATPYCDRKEVGECGKFIAELRF